MCHPDQATLQHVLSMREKQQRDKASSHTLESGISGVASPRRDAMTRGVTVRCDMTRFEWIASVPTSTDRPVDVIAQTHLCLPLGIGTDIGIECRTLSVILTAHEAQRARTTGACLVLTHPPAVCPAFAIGSNRIPEAQERARREEALRSNALPHHRSESRAAGYGCVWCGVEWSGANDERLVAHGIAARLLELTRRSTRAPGDARDSRLG